MAEKTDLNQSSDEEVFLVLHVWA